MPANEICIKILQLINSLHKHVCSTKRNNIDSHVGDMTFQIPDRTPLEISIYSFPGGNLEIYLKSILSFVTFKMLILLKFYRIISSVLYRLCSVLISFKFIKSLICNFLKFRESMTSMMRICLLRASTNGILL